MHGCIYSPSCIARSIAYCGLLPDSHQMICRTQSQHFGEYQNKSSLRSASHAGRQNSVTGGGSGHKQFFLGGAQNVQYFKSEIVDQKKKDLHLEICADFHKFWGEDKKKLFISKSARIFTNSGVKPQKKRSLL